MLGPQLKSVSLPYSCWQIDPAASKWRSSCTLCIDQTSAIRRMESSWCCVNTSTRTGLLRTSYWLQNTCILQTNHDAKTATNKQSSPRYGILRTWTVCNSDHQRRERCLRPCPIPIQHPGFSARGSGARCKIRSAYVQKSWRSDISIALDYTNDENITWADFISSGGGSSIGCGRGGAGVTSASSDFMGKKHTPLVINQVGYF